MLEPSAMMLWTCLAGLLGVLAFRLLRFWNFRRRVSKIPGPPGYPIVGMLFELLGHDVTDTLPYMKKLWKEHCCSSGIHQVTVLDRAMITICRPEFHQILLSSQEQISKSADYKFIVPWVGNGILTNTGSDWHVRRKLLTPAFHFRILEDFYGIMNTHAVQFAEKLTKKVGQGPFPFFPCISHATLDMICESAMGYKMEELGESIEDYLKGIHIVTKYGQYRSLQPWFYNDWMYSLSSRGKTSFRYIKAMKDFTNKVIQDRRKQRQSGGKQKSDKAEEVLGQKKRMAFLDLILEAADKNKLLTDQDIQEEVDTIMFAGHDTTATAITWTLYTLGHNREIQNKLRQEIYDVTGHDRGTPVTREHLANLKYMDRVIKEALRMYPPVGGLARVLSKDVAFGDYVAPEGSMVYIIPYLYHRNPDQFPNPEVFNPDRFLPEEVEKRHPYAYIPFSAGPRNCIGQRFAMMEMKIILCHLLRSYAFDSHEAPEDLKLSIAAVMTAQSGVLLSIERV